MKFSIRILFILIAVCGLSLATWRGCPTRARMAKVQEGMTEAEVRQIMIASPNVSGRAGEGRDYMWVWHRSYSFMGVLVVEFSPDGKVTNVYHEN